MDIFDEVVMIEENAYKQGEEIGRKRVEEIVKEKSSVEGRENGYYIAREFGYIQGYAQIVDKEEHIREQHTKVISSILSMNISPEMPAEEINRKILEIRNLYKQLLSLLKIKTNPTSSSELF